MRQLQNRDIHARMCERGCEVLPNTHMHLRCAHASLSGQHPLLLLPLRLLIVNVLASLIGLSGEHKSNRNRVDAFITACPPPPRFCQTAQTRSCSQIKVLVAFIYVYLSTHRAGHVTCSNGHDNKGQWKERLEALLKISKMSEGADNVAAFAQHLV